MARFELISADLAARIGLRRWVLVTLATSLSINVILAMAILSKTDRVTTVLMPVTDTRPVASFEVTETTVSPDYLSLVARDLLTMVTYNTPTNVDRHRAQLMKYVAPESFGAIEAELVREAQLIKAKHASLLFDVTGHAVNANDLTVDFAGLRRTLIGKEETAREAMTYRLSFRMKGGRLYLKSIETFNNRGEAQR